MAQITYIEFGGTEHIVDLQPGQTVMEGAVSNNIPGIDAECGGACSCATCHCYIETAWMERVGPPSEMEAAMLEFAEHVEPNSRLSCQVEVDETLDGLIVRLLESQG